MHAIPEGVKGGFSKLLVTGEPERGVFLGHQYPVFPNFNIPFTPLNEDQLFVAELLEGEDIESTIVLDWIKNFSSRRDLMRKLMYPTDYNTLATKYTELTRRVPIDEANRHFVTDDACKKILTSVMPDIYPVEALKKNTACTYVS